MLPPPPPPKTTPPPHQKTWTKIDLWDENDVYFYKKNK